MKAHPLVSVITPTYKRSDMLVRSIQSVLSQTYPYVEVLIIDDNDPGTEYRTQTENKMKQFHSEPRVRYIKHAKNLNGSVARNTGIQNAKGDIITFLDDDDVYLPTKIEKQVNYLLKHPEYKAVYCGWKRDNVNILPKGEGDLSFNILSGKGIIITNSIMMWREEAIKCGGWNVSLRRHQEAAFLLNYFRIGGLIGRIGEVLIEFDTTDRSNVANAITNEEQLLYLLDEYSDIISRCEKKRKHSSNKIYSSRYLGIILTYIRCGDFMNAFKKYLKYMKKYPIRLNISLFIYSCQRLSPFRTKQSR